VVVARMTQKVRVIPTISEGFFVGTGLERPLPFTAKVEDRGVIKDFPIEGWDGQVIEGQDQFIGKRVILTRRLANYNDAVVACIFSEQGTELFSGICEAKGLS
jgi:hypothetical protein